MKTIQKNTKKQTFNSLQEEKQEQQGGIKTSSIESPNAKNANAVQQMANESPIVQKATQLKSIIQKRVKPTIPIKNSLENETIMNAERARDTNSESNINTISSNQSSNVAQLIKGDKADPHQVHEKESLSLEGDEISNNHVQVPNVSGCAAINISVKKAGKLLKKIVFHSDGTAKDDNDGEGTSLDKADEIANEIISLKTPKKKSSEGDDDNLLSIHPKKDSSQEQEKISVDILVIVKNDHHSEYNKRSITDHNKVIRVITNKLSSEKITFKERTERLRNTPSKMNIDLTGQDQDILERYKENIYSPEMLEKEKLLREQYFSYKSEIQKNNQPKKRSVKGSMFGKKVEPKEKFLSENEFLNLSNEEKIEELKRMKAKVKKTSKTGCCYITTACVEYMGFDDDCEELTILREFRDNYLINKENGVNLIKIYYQYSPLIVEAIKRREDEIMIWAKLYQIIKQCVEAIKKNNNEFAFNTYCKMVMKLKEDFIPDVEVPHFN